MASEMGICLGLVGPKSENVEKVLVLKAFLKGSRGGRAPQECEKVSGPERFDVQKTIFLIRNASCRFPESYVGREHIFKQIRKKGCRKVKNAAKMMPDRSKCHQHGIGYIKMSSK